MYLWTYVEQAGFIGYVMVVLSIITVTIALERKVFWLTRGKGYSENKKRETLEAFSQQDASYLEGLCDASPFSRVAKHLWEHRTLSREALLDMTMSRESLTLYRFNGILDNNSAIAPMIGILGTMLGIIQSFSGMKGGAPDTTVMVAGISVAMLTTAMGLIVSIFSLLFYNYFSSKAYQSQIELAEFVAEAADHLKTEVKPSLSRQEDSEVAVDNDED